MAKKAVKEKDVDVFDEKEEVEEVEEFEDEVEEPDDIKEGIMAESDPASKLKDNRLYEQTPAEDVVKMSMDGQITALGRKTAALLEKSEKRKVLIPKDTLNPGDGFVVVGINGWNMQIKREVPVYLPDEIIDLLIGGGYNPTLVR